MPAAYRLRVIHPPRVRRFREAHSASWNQARLAAGFPGRFQGSVFGPFFFGLNLGFPVLVDDDFRLFRLGAHGNLPRRGPLTGGMLLHCRAHESGKQRMRLRRFAFEFRMELHSHEPRMLRQFNDLYK